MSHPSQRGRWYQSGLILGMLLFLAAPAAAFQFTLGEVQASLDTTVSYGLNWRVEDSDPDRRPLAVGHSFGGNGFGLISGVERYAAALFVGVQSGYWRHWSGMGRAGMWLLTHLLLPGVAPTVGYFPARLFGQGEDLPAGVAVEWASWCRHPEYAAGALAADGYPSFAGPIRSYWITDDRYAPRPAAEAALRLYRSAPAELRPVSPADVGARRIGHFGFFRDQFRDSLWREAADWLLAPRR